MPGGVTTITEARPDRQAARPRLTVAPTLSRAVHADGARLDRSQAPHRAPEITVRIRRLADGSLRFVPVRVPEFATVASRPVDLPVALRRCFAEVEIAAYAAWKGEVNDGLHGFGAVDDDPLPGPMPPPPGRNRGRGGQPWRSGGNEREQNPSVYHANADGSWTSTVTGRTFRDPKAVATIVRRRLQAGLPIVPADAVFDLSTVAERIGNAAALAGVTAHEWIAAVVAAATTEQDAQVTA